MARSGAAEAGGGGAEAGGAARSGGGGPPGGGRPRTRGEAAGEIPKWPNVLISLCAAVPMCSIAHLVM